MIRLLTNELKINWLESITSQSNNRSFNLVLRLFFYFKGEKMNIEKIRQLNDSFRKSFNGGRIVITRCVQSLTDDDRNELIKQVQAFDNFTEDNDPYGEHDFGAINFKTIRTSGKSIITTPIITISALTPATRMSQIES